MTSHLFSHEGSVLTFPNGSKTAAGVGSVFVSGRDTRSCSQPKNSSVFTSELAAISKALCFLEVSDGTRHVILSDSLRSLLALRTFIACGSQLGHLCSFAGSPVMSASAAMRLLMLRQDVPPRSASTLGPWISSSRRQRHQEVSLYRLRTGHTYAAHGYLLRGEERPACPHCSIPLTVDHVLLKCPRFSVSRRRHFEYITPNVTLRHLLGHASKRIQTGSLFSYVLDIKFPVVYSSH